MSYDKKTYNRDWHRKRYQEDPEFREKVRRARRERYYRNHEAEKKKNRVWKIANPEKVREQKARWNAENVESVRESHRRDIRKRWADPEGRRKHSARRKVAYAVKTGKLVRPTVCPECNGPGPIQAHHEDYDKPLEVIWVCRPCHRRGDVLGVYRPVLIPS